MIYFVQAPTGGQIKIGTTRRLTGRLPEVSKAAGTELVVLAVLDGDRSVEAELHRQFSHLRADGEWFVVDSELVDYIRENGREWDGTDEVPSRNLGSVRIDAGLVARARIAASYKGLSLPDYLLEVLGPIVDKDIDEGHEMLKKASKDNSAPKR